ncbi:MAG: BlaI/MecI/CopY family transcriptional regulator [Isosphaeraceae bacterium]|nr:BlaI/MecI/CopY family transcriptional regulator [Isosphaeraceae bacterium]
MSRTSQDVTEAELTLLQHLWTEGEATIRKLTESAYGEVGPSSYATVQKLLDRLEAKGFVTRDRNTSIHTFRAAVGRDDLIARRLREVADKLCDGMLTPLLTHLVKMDRFSETDRAALRSLIEGDSSKGNG